MNNRERLTKEAIELLLVGDAKAFNKWRIDNSTLSSGLNLEDITFPNIDFRGMNLSHSSFRKSKFKYGNFFEADCTNSNFAYAEFSGTELRGGNFKDAYMFRTRFLTCKLDQETLAEANTKETVILTRLSSVKILP